MNSITVRSNLNANNYGKCNLFCATMAFTAGGRFNFIKAKGGDICSRKPLSHCRLCHGHGDLPRAKNVYCAEALREAERCARTRCSRDVRKLRLSPFNAKFARYGVIRSTLCASTSVALVTPDVLTSVP